MKLLEGMTLSSSFILFHFSLLLPPQGEHRRTSDVIQLVLEENCGYCCVFDAFIIIELQSDWSFWISSKKRVTLDLQFINTPINIVLISTVLSVLN